VSGRHAKGKDPEQVHETAPATATFRHGQAAAISRSTSLTDEQERFVSVSPSGNLRAWYKFVEDHPKIFDNDKQIPVYVDAAVKALKDKDNTRARGCIEKAALLGVVNGRSYKFQDELFDAIRQGASPMVDQYIAAFRKYEQHCRKKAGVTQVTQSQAGQKRIGRKPPIDIDDPAEPGLEASIRGMSGNAEFESLDKRFVRRDARRAGKFFKVGRVFAILAHTEYNKKIDETATDAKWVTKKGDIYIYSHVRHFAVVREGHGYCWAVMINTYSGKGVAKPGLSPEDIQAHAIIHDSEYHPRRTYGEPEMTKKPIEVDLSEDADNLSSASRINFAKVTTVEHNVRAMAVALISKDSMANFTAYWRQHLLG
jgi:hypothetical protein